MTAAWIGDDRARTHSAISAIPRVAGRAIELGQQRAGAQRPGQRVLAAAGADQKDVHRAFSRGLPSGCLDVASQQRNRCIIGRSPLSTPDSPISAGSANRSAGGNAPEFTVSELSGAIKRALEEGFGYVRLRGEISGFRGPHASGHCYFALKDDKAKIEAVIWKASYAPHALQAARRAWRSSPRGASRRSPARRSTRSSSSSWSRRAPAH